MTWRPKPSPLWFYALHQQMAALTNAESTVWTSECLERTEVKHHCLSFFMNHYAFCLDSNLLRKKICLDYEKMSRIEEPQLQEVFCCWTPYRAELHSLDGTVWMAQSFSSEDQVKNKTANKDSLKPLLEMDQISAKVYSNIFAYHVIGLILTPQQFPERKPSNDVSWKREEFLKTASTLELMFVARLFERFVFSATWQT